MEAEPRRVGVLHSLTVVDTFVGSKPSTAFSEGPVAHAGESMNRTAEKTTQGPLGTPRP